MAEPLRIVLSGKCFTALLAKSRTRSKNWSRDVGTRQYSPRYIGTMFSLLGHMPFPVSVLSHLQHQLLTKSPAPSLSCHPAGAEEDESSQGINTRFSITDRSSILSPVTSTAIEQSPLVSVRSFSSLGSFKLSQVALESSACDGKLYPNSQLDLSVLLSDSNELSDDFSETAPAGFTGGVGEIGKTEEKWGKSVSGQNTPLKLLSSYGGLSKRLATGFTDSFEEIGKSEDCCLPHEAQSSSSCWKVGLGASFSGKGTACCMEDEDVLLCDDVLSELMSTWRDEGHSIQQKKNSPQIYEDSETLPDSESFLEEFQCDFDHSPNFLTTKVALPTFESSSVPDTADISPTYGRTHSARYSSLFNSSEKATSDVASLLQRTPLVQYTPELFTSSASRPSHRASTNTSNTATSPAGGVMSPELFSSPRPIVPLAVGKLSSEASTRCTPAAGGDLKQPPKRRLLHPLHTSVQQACTCTPLSSVNDSPSQCFSPELFP